MCIMLMKRGTLFSAPMEQESGINIDKNRSGVMHQRPHNWVENSGDGQGNGQEIQTHGEAQIAFDGGHHPFG